MKKRTILYVEDEQWLMEGVVDSLSASYNVITVRNGDRALDYLESNKGKVDLILLDIMMPQEERIQTADHGRTSGVEFARIVLEEIDPTLPIVCYTVVTDSEVKERLYQIGVKEIVSKRKLPSELEKVIEKYLS